MLGFPPYGCCGAHWGCSGGGLGRTVGSRWKVINLADTSMLGFPPYGCCGAHWGCSGGGLGRTGGIKVEPYRSSDTNMLGFLPLGKSTKSKSKS